MLSSNSHHRRASGDQQQQQFQSHDSAFQPQQQAFAEALQSHAYHQQPPSIHLRTAASMPTRPSMLSELTAAAAASSNLFELADIAVSHAARMSAMQVVSPKAEIAAASSTSSPTHRASTSGMSSGGSQPKLARHASDGNSVTKPHTQRKYAKICTVCGDKALGYNFDAISCESCKAFFRRNAQKLSSLRCAYNDNCQIDKANRKLCRRCRLRKCFRVGMRIEYIQSEEQKQRKRDLIVQNRGHKKSGRESASGSVQSQTSNEEDDDIFPDGGSNSQQASSHQGQASAGGYTKKRNPSSSSSYTSASRSLSPQPSSAYTTPMVERRGSFKVSSGEPMQYEPGNQQQAAQHPPGYCIVPAGANELTVEDCRLIDEAVNAWKNSLMLMQDVSSTPTTVGNGVTCQEDLLNVSEISFRRMVSMFKNIHFFKNLNLEDQKALLRGGALDLLIMRSALIYNPETHMFLDPTDDPNYFGIHSSELRQMADSVIVDGLVKLVETLKLRLQVDDVMLILLLMITLFSDDRAEVLDRPAVARVQESYSTALQHYIQTMRATSRGACSVLFADLIVKLRELRALSTTYETVVPFLKQWAIKPLMRELLKLSTPNDTPTISGGNVFYGQANNLSPGVDEDLAAAQQLFREHAAMMASHNFMNSNNIGPGSSIGMGNDQQQQSPGNPGSVSGLSLLGGDQSYDLASINVDLQ